MHDLGASCCVHVVFTILIGALPFLLWDLIQAFLLNQLWMGPPAAIPKKHVTYGPASSIQSWAVLQKRPGATGNKLLPLSN